MLNVQKIIKMYTDNSLRYLLECDETIKVSKINKVFEKINNKRVFSQEVNRTLDRDELDINLLKDNIDAMNNILENKGYLLCHKSFNPIINNSNIELLLEEKDIPEDFIKITKSNLAEYRDKLEKFIITNSIFNPCIEVSKNELNNTLIYDVYKNNCTYLINSSFIRHRDFENILEYSNLNLDLERRINILKEFKYYPRNFSINLILTINNNSKVFNSLNQIIKNDMHKQNIYTYIGKFLYKDIEKINTDMRLDDVINKLQDFNFSKEEISEYLLKINLSKLLLGTIYNKQCEDFKLNFSDFKEKWEEEINKKVFEKYINYNPFIPSDDIQKMKFYGVFTSKAKNKLINQYNNYYNINDSIVYKSISSEKNVAFISINDISKRIASNLYYDKLEVDYEFFINNEKWKIKRNKESICISYPKGANKEYVDFLVFGLIDFLIDKQKERTIYNMPNREITMLCEAHLESLLRVINLKIKTSDDKLEVRTKPKL